MKIKKVSSLKSIQLKSNALKNQIGLNNTSKNKQSKKKEAFNITPQRLKPVPAKPRHSNLLIPNDPNIIRDKGASKKKVSFKSERKYARKEIKVIVPKGGIYENESLNNSIHKKNKISIFNKK